MEVSEKKALIDSAYSKLKGKLVRGLPKEIAATTLIDFLTGRELSAILDCSSNQISRLKTSKASLTIKNMDTLYKLYNETSSSSLSLDAEDAKRLDYRPIYTPEQVADMQNIITSTNDSISIILNQANRDLSRTVGKISRNKGNDEKANKSTIQPNKPSNKQTIVTNKAQSNPERFQFKQSDDGQSMVSSDKGRTWYHLPDGGLKSLQRETGYVAKYAENFNQLSSEEILLLEFASLISKELGQDASELSSNLKVFYGLLQNYSSLNELEGLRRKYSKTLKLSHPLFNSLQDVHDWHKGLEDLANKSNTTISQLLKW